MTIEEAHYKDLESSIKTGDVIGFSGTDYINGMIEWGTHSKYSHVGMAIWLKVNTEFKLFCAESTTLNKIPARDGFYHRGVQITLLHQRLDAARMPIVLFPLETDFSEQLLIDWLLQQESSNVPYNLCWAIEAGILKQHWLLKTLLYPFTFWLQIVDPQVHGLFCSEMVTAALQHIKIVSSYIDPKIQTPQDVLNFKIYKDPIRILLI